MVYAEIQRNIVHSEDKEAHYDAIGEVGKQHYSNEMMLNTTAVGMEVVV